MAICTDLWDPASQLYTNPLMQKGLSADTSAAYGLMGFYGNNPLMKLVLKGKFPKCTYMSVQIYRGRTQTAVGVGAALSDYRINPSSGLNRFQTHNPNDVGDFEIEITPDQTPAPNRIWYDPVPGTSDISLISAFYRVFQPDGPFSFADLPQIEARNFQTNAVLPCPTAARLDWYLDIPEPVMVILNSVIPKQNPLTFHLRDEAPGTNQDATYMFSYSNIPVGEVAVIKFRAPALDFASQSALTNAVRYWSICPIYWPMLKTLNGVPCDWTRPLERDVTVVFGPKKPSILAKAASLNADFLPDTRTATQQVMGFIVRNVLPSPTFEPLMYKNQFLPRGDVYTEQQFLNL